jgi:hypothetical protein
MPRSTIDCEIADVVIVANGQTATFKVPAYTREADEVEVIIQDMLRFYLSEESAPCLADFAFLVLSRAALEQKEIEQHTCPACDVECLEGECDNEKCHYYGMEVD